MGKLDDIINTNSESINLRKRISKVNYHDLGNHIKKNRLIIDCQQIVNKSNSKQCTRKPANPIVSAKWTEKEKEYYETFIRMNKEILMNPLKKHSLIYNSMSQFLITKTPNQCKNYHQRHYRKTLVKLNIKKAKDDSISLSTSGSGIDFRRDNEGSPMNIERSEAVAENSIFDQDHSFGWDNDMDMTFGETPCEKEYNFSQNEFASCETPLDIDFDFLQPEENQKGINLFDQSFFQNDFNFHDFSDTEFPQQEANVFEDFDLLL